MYKLRKFTTYLNNITSAILMTAIGGVILY